MQASGSERAVFLAAVGGGRPRSRRVAEALRDRDVQALQPPEGYPSDADPQRLNEDVGRASAAVLFLDKRGLTSPWLLEVARLLRFRADNDATFRLVPVISGIQWADLRNSPLGGLRLEEGKGVDWDEAGERAEEEVLALLELGPPEPEPQAPPPEPEPRAATPGADPPGPAAVPDPAAPPRARVRFAGTVRPLSAAVDALLRGVARLVAEEGGTLVTAGARGVDLVARRAFLDALGDQSAAGRILTYPRELTTPSEFVAVPGEERVEREAGASVPDSHLVIPFPGGAGTRLAIESAEKHDRPVLALPRAGGTATAAHDKVLAEWETRPVPGLTREEYVSLESVTAESIEALRPLLRKVLHAVAPLAPGAAPRTDPFTRALLANDLTKGEDLLGVRRQARTFAEVIAAREVEAPLAIGLFGEWGSGKSFFMERVDKELEELLGEERGRREAARALGAPFEPVSWEQVCRIRFNAWHYMDADLWASMAGRIFDGLAEYLHEHEGKRSSVAEERRELRARLSSAYRRREEAQARKRALEQSRDGVRVRVAQLAVEREQALRRVDRLAAEAIRQRLAEDERVAAARAELEEAAKAAGVEVRTPELLHSPDGIERLERRVRSVETRFAHLVPSPRALALALFVVVGLGFGSTLLLGLLGVAVELSLGGWAALLLLGGALGGIGTYAKWLDSARKLLGAAEDLRTAAAGVRERAAEQGLTDLERTERKVLAKREQELAEAERKLGELDGDVHEAEARLAEIDAGRLVYDFVEARAGEDGYQAREGIVSVVRRDLETLSGLLRGWREAEAKEAEGADEPARPEHAPEPAADGLSAEERRLELEAMPIQRIVLYIDDLDRCPPSQVVRVLQAVHLLLAFDLFVVLVGVDARWLERSLRIEYRDLVGGDGATRALHHSSATPHEYLEKIFQVPYTLPVVGAGGFRRLVTKMLPTRRGGDSGSSSTEGSPEGPFESDQDVLDALEQADLLLAETAQDPDIVVEGGGRQLVVQLKEDREAARRALLRRLDGAPPRARDFRIETHEQDFLKGLHPFLTTPRLVKRFVNVYRLLRVQAAREDYAAFAADRPDASFRVVQTLLAMNIGFPRAGALLLGLLAADDWAPDIKSEAPTWPVFLAAVAPAAPDSGSLLRRRLGLDPTAPGADEDRRVRELRALHPLLVRLPELPDDIRPWRDWAAKVGRYSFYWADT